MQVIHTESALWKKLKKHEDRFVSLRRIESPITPGASDVEYVTHSRSGWIELKTCNDPRPCTRFTLHSPYTLPQAKFSRAHHAPQNLLYSYMLLAVIGARTWKEFLLLEPDVALLLLEGWVGVVNEDIRRRAFVTTHLDFIVEYILQS